MKPLLRRLLLRLLEFLASSAPILCVVLFRPLGLPFALGMIAAVVPWALAYQARYGVDGPDEWIDLQLKASLSPSTDGGPLGEPSRLDTGRRKLQMPQMNPRSVRHVFSGYVVSMAVLGWIGGGVTFVATFLSVLLLCHGLHRLLHGKWLF